MLGRTFACAVMVMVIARPAAAGERRGYSPAADALPLLMQDESATSGPEIPSPPPAPSIARSSLAEFETLAPPSAIIAAGQAGDIASPFALVAEATALTESTTGTFGSRYAIDDAMAAYPKPYRPRALLDTMVTIHLDGEEATRSFSVGGVAGVVWGVLPRK